MGSHFKNTSESITTCSLKKSFEGAYLQLQLSETTEFISLQLSNKLKQGPYPYLKALISPSLDS